MTDVSPRTPGVLHPALRAGIAAALVATARTGLAALRDGYVPSGGEWSDLMLLGLSNRWIESFAPALAMAFVLAWLRSRWKDEHAPLIWAAVMFLTFQFVRFALPPERFYTPSFAGARGVAVHVAAALVAFLAAWILSPRAFLPLPRTALLASAALVFGALGLGIRAAGRTPSSWPERPNVILISLDTLRADRLGCYGYEHDTTPELDRFAERAVRFTRALTPQPWTLTAHMSLLTAQHPLVHRVDQDRALPASIPLLSEELRLAGYTTIGIVDECPWMKPTFGFDRGFDVYQRVRDDAEAKIDRIARYLDDAGTAPLFLFAHFFDAHSDRRILPYESAPEDRESLAGWYEGDFTGCEPELGCASLYLDAINRRGETIDPERLRYVSSLYDAGVRSLDRKLGRLFRELEQRGLFETSIVVVTADHGEEFQEHGKLLHEQLVAPCVNVPLLVRTPDVEQARAVEALVSLMDVGPTLLELCGQDPALRGGSSLVPLLRGDSAASRSVLLDSGAGEFVLHTEEGLAWRTSDGDLLARRGGSGEPSAIVEGTPEAELRDRLVAEIERLRALGDRHGQNAQAVDLQELDVDSLRALGYTGDEPGEGQGEGQAEESGESTPAPSGPSGDG